MPERQPLSREQILQRFSDDPLLAEFATPLPDLLGRGRGGPTGSFQELAKLLGAARKPANIQFTLSEGSAVRHWSVSRTASGSTVSEREHKSPTLEILTSTQTWTEIASGKLTPLEAFVRGRLRVRGDIALARLLVRQLQRR
jgi:putative sterol carrier protein